MIRKTIPLIFTLTFLFWVTHLHAEQLDLILDLDPAPAANDFQVDVTVSFGIFTESDSQNIVYSGILRPQIDVDFSDPFNPFVNSINFLGQPGDISHSDATFDLGVIGLVSLLDIQGRVETPMPPSPVSNGIFDGEDHEVIFAQGTIDFSNAAIDDILLANDPMTGGFVGQDNSTVDINLTGINNGEATYEVVVAIPVEMASVDFDDPVLEQLLSITIDGDLVGRGTFTRAIPEPSGVLISSIVCIVFAVRRRR